MEVFVNSRVAIQQMLKNQNEIFFGPLAELFDDQT